MKWSTKLGTFAGIDVYVHTTFLMLIAWVAFAHSQTGHSAAAALGGSRVHPGVVHMRRTARVRACPHGPAFRVLLSNSSL